jgi:hypothetical protein
MSDPVRHFEHTHGHMAKLVVDADTAVRALLVASTPELRDDLRDLLVALRDDLLVHFADEEEALFPFIRASVPGQTAAVERLEAAHDAICGSLVRMVQVLSGDGSAASLSALPPLHERFARTYAQHSADEATLLDELTRALDADGRGELARQLRSVRSRSAAG